MNQNKKNMIEGNPYYSSDNLLVKERESAHAFCAKFNYEIQQGKKSHSYFKDFFRHFGEDSYIEPPFFCDYGYNITIGKNVYFNCTILDCAPVTIGKRVKFGPGVSLLTASHPIDPIERASLREYAYPILIEADVWIGGNVVVLPGVTIGSCSVIGAGSVVTKGIPANVIAVGNPCKPIKTIPNPRA